MKNDIPSPSEEKNIVASNSANKRYANADGDASDELTSVIETQEESIVRFSMTGQILFFNQAFCDLTGFSRQKLLGKNISSVFSFRLSPDLHPAWDEMLAAPRHVLLDEGMILRNGIKRWIQWVGVPIISSEKEIEGIQAVGHDVTSLKRAEETVRVQRDLAVLLNESRDGFVSDEALCKILGSLSSFSLFGFYLFDSENSTYLLKQQQTVFTPGEQFPQNVALNSSAGSLFSQPELKFYPSTTSEVHLAFPGMNPAIKSLAIIPIRLKGSHLAALLFGSTEYIDLPAEIREQLRAINQQLENIFAQLQTRSNLSQHESDLHALFCSLEQMLLVINEEGLILDTNRSLLGKKRKELIRDHVTIFDLHPVEYTDLIRAAIDKLIKDRHSQLMLPIIDEENKRNDVEIEFSFTNWKGRDEIVAAYKNISQQMRLQEMEREQREFASNLVAIAGMLNSSLDLDIILDHIIDSLDKVVHTSTGNILLVESNTKGQVIRQHGYDRMGTAEALTSRIFELQKTKTFAEMLASKHELLIADTHSYPDWIPMPESFWVRSFVSAPIVIKDQVYAFLNCDNAVPGFFTETHARRLKLLADQAAIAIENANVYAETKNRLKQIALINELTQTMLDSNQLNDILFTLPQKILAVFDANSLLITKWDPETKIASQLVAFGKGILPNLPKSSKPGSVSFTEQVIEQKHALVVSAKEENAHWRDQLSMIFSDRVIVALPMIAGDNPLGAILIGFPESRQITPTEISLGEYVSTQISTILNKSNIYERAKLQSAQFQHANDLIASLSFVATTILSTKGVSDIIQTMGDGLEKMDIHSLLFFKDEPDYLSLEYSSRNAELLAQLKSLGSVPDGKTKLPLPNTDEFKLTLDQQQIVFIDNPVQVLRFVLPSEYGPFVNKFQEALAINADTKSLFLPLIVEQKTIGLLGLYGKNLQEIDLKAGEIFNSQISVALENARLLAEVQRLAVTDELTCINNRRGLFEMGNRELSIAKRLNHPLAALMIDLDNFKDVNDKYGHAVGDIALREISSRIVKNIRDIDLVGRYGGEEFVALLVGDDLPTAITVAERIRQAIWNEEITTESGPIKLTVSIGVDELDSMTANLEMLIKRADRALYVAKHNGRNQVATLMNIENLRP